MALSTGDALPGLTQLAEAEHHDHDITVKVSSSHTDTDTHTMLIPKMKRPPTPNQTLFEGQVG